MKRIAGLAILALAAAAALALPRVWADGIAGDGALHYSGVLEEDGVPVDGTRAVELVLWDHATDDGEEHVACAMREDQADVIHGRFRVALGASCAEAVRAHPDLWIEVRVSGESMGRTRIGAVPYAVESGRAAEASGPLRREIDALVPPGAVIAFAGTTPPDGWLVCDGSILDRDDYPALFAAIGTTHGEGGEPGTFRLPDHRGRFLRGVDAGAGRDPDAASRAPAAAGGSAGDAVGAVQGFATAAPNAPFVTSTNGGHTHTHDFPSDDNAESGINEGTAQHDLAESRTTSAAGDHQHTITGGDFETRPENAGVLWIIRH